MTDELDVPGTVFAKGDGWMAQLPPSMGRRGKMHFDREQAIQWLREENAKRILGIVDPVKAKSAPVSDLVQVWMTAHATMKGSTRADYEYYVEKYVTSSHLGAIPIADVLPLHVDQVLISAPANNSRIRLATILSSFFGWAENNLYTVGNPYRRSQALAIRKKTLAGLERREGTDNVWTPKQVTRFIEHEANPVYRDVWTFIACTAARRGEALGATWPNMHPDAGWAMLEDNVTTGRGRTIYEERPKNGKRRKVYFNSLIGEMLKARKAEQDAYRAQCDTWEGPWVFDRRRTRGSRGDYGPGTAFDPDTITERFNRHTKELGLPYLRGPHGLRRTYATIADKELKVRESVRIDALGHATDVPGIYNKASEEELRDLAAKVEALILPNGLITD